MVTQKQVESDCLDGVRDLLLEESSKKVEVSTQNLLNVDTRDSMIQEERSTIEMNVHTETPDARKRVQARNVCDTMINRQISSSLKKREWTEMPADATSKQLWQWWVQNHHDDEEFAAAQSSHAHAPDVAPIDDASPTSEWLDGSSTWAAAATILLVGATLEAHTPQPEYVDETRMQGASVPVAVAPLPVRTTDAPEPIGLGGESRGAVAQTEGAASLEVNGRPSGRPPGVRRSRRTPRASFLPDYEPTAEEHAEIAEVRKWREMCAQFDSSTLGMHVGMLSAVASAPDGDDMMRVAGVMDEAGIPSANALMHMPTSVTPDEFLRFVVQLDLSGELDDFLESGAEGGDYGDFEDYEVTIILCGAEVDDMSVGGIVALTPDGTTPIDFARACVLLGAAGRALLLDALA
jgi:hypothetical protein